MARKHQGNRVQLQAEAPEVTVGPSSELAPVKEDLERNQTNQMPRPRLGTPPEKGEGMDGDMRFAKKGSKMFAYFRVDGRWYRTEMSNA